MFKVLCLSVSLISLFLSEGEKEHVCFAYCVVVGKHSTNIEL